MEELLNNYPTTTQFFDTIQEENHNNEIINNWNTYCNNISNQIHSMWNFILYNQFVNEEVNKLQHKVDYVESKHISLKLNYENLQDENSQLSFTNKRLKRKLDKYENEQNNSEDVDIQIIKRRKNMLESEFDSLESEYQNISKDQKEDKLKEIFSSLNNIKDIIKMKDIQYKFDFLDNQKFVKIYNLIPSLEELDNIIGMDEIKNSIFKSICYFVHGLENKKELNHVMITGPPGVGKSTIARIIGKLYLDMGFLQNNKFITARRSDLIAKYLGQTAIKTQDVIDKALGGVLFIDEVYSLGSSDKKDSFAKECIDTINLNMTEAKKPWLLIVGGYKEDIEKSFLAYNRGLERRFTVRLNIDGYNAKELYLILKKFISDENWKIEDNSITLDTIQSNIESFKFFAGDMQKLFQKAKQFYSLRIMKENIDIEVKDLVLVKDDFDKAIEYFKSNSSQKDELDKDFMFSMYT